MKSRYSAFDIRSILFECREKLSGLRVLNIYDVDKKTYLIRFVRQDEKFVLLIESGIRIHLTDFDWPKNMMPSGFTMKLRKHLRQKRLESIEMMGLDRIINMQFGVEETSFHIILELYDRGNIILTDHEGRIMSLLRPRALNEETKFAVNELYPFHLIKIKQALPDPEATLEKVITYISTNSKKVVEKPEEPVEVGKKGKKANSNPKNPTGPTSIPLKKLLSSALSILPYGAPLLEHCLLTKGCKPDAKVTLTCSDRGSESTLYSLVSRDQLLSVFALASELYTLAGSKINEGFIFCKKAKQEALEGQDNSTQLYEDFEPMLYAQSEGNASRLAFPSFSKCADEFFSKVESQKLDVKAENQEKTAIKKLENVRQDHINRRINLKKSQDDSAELAELIELNRDLVDRAIQIIQSGLAAQMNWGDLKASIEEGQRCGDPIALCIKSLKLDTSRMVMILKNPFEQSDDKGDDTTNNKGKNGAGRQVEIDLNLSAYNNARSYYERKRQALIKELKTLESSGKALKSAERKTKQLLKDFQTQVSINKSRKVYWFEKFYWFLSSENYLVLAGRDQQQNELLVKKYLKPGDLYVHADIHGGSSVVIKNPTGEPVGPKTLNESGVMAACYSSAWDAKITVAVWWVHHDQVSKTAPTGEYLTTGSFMIRGKKNFLPPITLIMGFGIMFKLDEASAERHRRDGKIKMREASDFGDSVDQSEQGEDLELHMSNDESNHESNDGENAFQNDKNDPLEEEGDIGDERGHLFPDTELTGPISTSLRLSESKDNEEPEYSALLAPPIATKSMQKLHHRRKKNEKLMPNLPEIQQPNLVDKLSAVGEAACLKRGQKAKLKKIREKYGNQDEEERKLKLELLAANAQTNQMSKAAKKAKAKQAGKVAKGGEGTLCADKKAKVSLFDQFKPIATEAPLPHIAANGDGRHLEKSRMDGHLQNKKSRRAEAIASVDDDVAYDSSQDEDNPQGGPDDSLLTTLTGRPCYADPENPDTIMFALPVCAPYTALQDFKYRVKVIPGFSKRGKAGKTALSYFLSLASKPVPRQNTTAFTAPLKARDKSVEDHSERKELLTALVPGDGTAANPFGAKNASSNPALLERALIKAIKDNDLSRNIPSRVKIYVPASVRK